MTITWTHKVKHLEFKPGHIPNAMLGALYSTIEGKGVTSQV